MNDNSSAGGGSAKPADMAVAELRHSFRHCIETLRAQYENRDDWCGSVTCPRCGPAAQLLERYESALAATPATETAVADLRATIYSAVEKFFSDSYDAGYPVSASECAAAICAAFPPDWPVTLSANAQPTTSENAGAWPPAALVRLGSVLGLGPSPDAAVAAGGDAKQEPTR